MADRNGGNMQVAIIGGGIGGMTLALSLHAAGIGDVAVYSRHRPSVSRGGHHSPPHRACDGRRPRVRLPVEVGPPAGRKAPASTGRGWNRPVLPPGRRGTIRQGNCRVVSAGGHLGRGGDGRPGPGEHRHPARRPEGQASQEPAGRPPLPLPWSANRIARHPSPAPLPQLASWTPKALIINALGRGHKAGGTVSAAVTPRRPRRYPPHGTRSSSDTRTPFGRLIRSLSGSTHEWRRHKGMSRPSSPCQ